MEKKQAHLGLTAYNQNDVLKGRGIIINNSPGNVQYRSIVNAWKRRYVYANRESKPWYSEQIYKQIQDMNPPGRFLKYDKSSARWYIIPKKDALHKIRQALRENARGIMQEPPPQQDVKEDHLLRVEVSFIFIITCTTRTLIKYFHWNHNVCTRKLMKISNARILGYLTSIGRERDRIFPYWRTNAKVGIQPQG